MKLRVWTAILFVAGAVSGCSGSTSAVIQTMQSAARGRPDATNVPLNPNFRYLRVTVGGRTALLVLGYVEAHPQGPIEVWYSAEREVIRLQNGRVVGAVGLTTEWRNVIVTGAPTWNSLGNGAHAIQIVRQRDTMPGYRYGLKESLKLVAAPPPAQSSLRNLDPQSLAWFEETTETDPRGPTTPVSHSGENHLPVARYAIAFARGTAEVVYGEQCLSGDLCFAWQRWPAAPSNAKVER